MVRWDLGGDPIPYPTGVLNRFYLALDPSEAPTQLCNESLSLSLMEENEEPSSPAATSSSSFLSPSIATPASSGRKRKGDTEVPEHYSSPTKKPSAQKGKGKGKAK